MLLITEDIKDTVTKKQQEYWYISGPFIQAGIVNGNKRRYAYDIVQPEINTYIKEKVETHRALGEFNHPLTPEINPKEASHKIVSLVETMLDENRGICNWMGKAKVLNTPNGLIAQALLEGGVQLAVSSRALGSLKQVNGINEVQGDFKICTPADIVYEPSAPDAFVNGILENKEWVIKEQSPERILFVENVKKDLRTQTLPVIKRNLLLTFQNFLRTL